MRQKNGSFFVIPILLLVLLVSPLEAQSDGSSLEMCLGAAADDSPVYPTTTFPSNIQELTAVFHRNRSEAHKELIGTWIAVDVENVRPNYVIARTDLNEKKGMDRGRFWLTLPRPFPPGKYRLEVTEAGKPWHSAEFIVVSSDKNVSIHKPEEIIPLKEGKVWTYSFVQEPGKGVTISEVPPGAVLGADGKLRATVIFRVAGVDEMGAHIEMRRGDVLFSEEWWQANEKGVSITQRKIEGNIIAKTPPQPLLPWPLKSPQTWEYEVEERSVKQVSHLWGPVPVKGPKGEEPGYVVLVEEPPRSIKSQIKTTVERHFLPGLGVVRSIFVTTVEDAMASREELVLR
jgi:hypothetical protein